MRSRGRAVTLIAARFPIPMRGNEHDAFMWCLFGINAFPIPMRGNEHDAFMWCLFGINAFPIPMRGNESIHGQFTAYSRYSSRSP